MDSFKCITRSAAYVFTLALPIVRLQLVALSLSDCLHEDCSIADAAFLVVSLWQVLIDILDTEDGQLVVQREAKKEVAAAGLNKLVIMQNILKLGHICWLACPIDPTQRNPLLSAGRSFDEITREDLMKAERKIVSMLHTAVGRHWHVSNVLASKSV